MPRHLHYILIGCALAALVPSASGGVSVFNIFQHGDFEDPELGIYPSYTDRNFQPGLGRWFSTSDRSSIITLSGYDPGRYSAVARGDAELRQDFFSFANDIVDVAGDISAAGAAAFEQQVVHISFWAAHPEQPVSNILVTLFYDDGSSIAQTYQTSTTGWEFFDVTAQQNPLLGLTGLSIFGNISGPTFLDDIQVLVAIPEPDSVTLLLAVIGSVLFVRRRGQR